MGTRADFYISSGDDDGGIDPAKLEWLGSIAWDGYQEGIPIDIRAETDVSEFRSKVADFIQKRKDGTIPSRGWPWPWLDSGTTDCVYVLHRGRVLHEIAEVMVPADGPCFDAPEWPDMTAKANMAQAGSDRSGIMLFTRPK